MSIYKHDEAGGQNMADVVNPSLTYKASSTYQASPQPFVQFQPSGHSFGHSSTPMSAQTSSVEATYPAGPVSGYSTYPTGESINNSNNQVDFGQHHSAQAPHHFGQHYSGHDGSAAFDNNTNNNDFNQQSSNVQAQDANLRTINTAILAGPAASNIDLYNNHGSVAHGALAQHGFTQNNTNANQQGEFQALATSHNMNVGNNMAYYPQQPTFMPQFPFNMNMMMPFQYGPHYNMYGQVFNTPTLSVMEPSVHGMMGPPSTIVSSVENWRHHVSSPAAESASHTTGTSQKVSPLTGFNPSGFDSFNPAVLATYNTIPTSEVDDRVAPVDTKPAMKKSKKSSKKARSCFVCTGINNEDMITCAHPGHKGTALFHLDCAGLLSKTDNGKRLLQFLPDNSNQAF